MEKTLDEQITDLMGNMITEAMSRAFNQGVEHCVQMIKYYYDKNELPQDLINSLLKLKK